MEENSKEICNKKTKENETEMQEENLITWLIKCYKGYLTDFNSNKSKFEN